MAVNLNWDDIRVARRRLEDQIRKDCARLETTSVDPEEIYQALESCRAWWSGELQDVEIPLYLK